MTTTAPASMAFAIVSVAGATSACADHGDAAALAMLERFYAHAAAAVAQLGGRVVKSLGDGLLATFPDGDLPALDRGLRALQRSGTALWLAYDARCRVQVRLGRGDVMAGAFGQPDGRFDIYGNALNRLFKLPNADYAVTDAVKAELDRP